MKSRIFFQSILTLWFFVTPQALRGEKRVGATIEPLASLHRIDETIPEGRKSYYSERLSILLRRWPPPGIPDISGGTNPIWMRGVRTPGQPDYIGVEKRILIRAPLDQVATMIESFEHYPEFFASLRQVRVINRDGNKLTVEWERDPPILFAPTIVYQTIYLIDHSVSSRVVYRYELKDSNSVNHSDGLIVIEKHGEEETLLTAFDFFDVNWGLLRKLAEGIIWRRSLASSYLGDAAFKLKAEHPDWSFHQIEQASQELVRRFPLETLSYSDGLAWTSRAGTSPASAD